ncbi:MAG: YdcF family protein [Oscillospiraceae bacterium]|nr:YdcF family protein [Oscillospiraceae bacterium]
MLFRCKKKLDRQSDLIQDNGKTLIDVLICEYKVVTDKITSLSMKFAGGSYILPISLVIGAASISFDNVYINVITMLLPIVLFFYVYNHLRYMALQFKLSGYARYLEERINEHVNPNDPILLWENTIARDIKQNGYEGFFLIVSYILIFTLILILSYNGLYLTWVSATIPVSVLLLISALYYFSISAILYFVSFFTNVHQKTYEKSKKADSNSGIITKNNYARIIVLIVIIMLTPISLFPLVFFSERASEPETGVIDSYDYVVVLGNKSENSIPSEDMKARLDCLLRWIDETNNTTIVLSGGNGEAQIMKEYLLQHNLTQRMILEEKSTSTKENFLYFKSLVSGKVLVITSDYHILRASIIGRKYGVEYDYLAAQSTHSTFLRSLFECFLCYYESIR